jgi:hypothetical protein
VSKADWEVKEVEGHDVLAGGEGGEGGGEEEGCEVVGEGLHCSGWSFGSWM